MWVLSSEGLQVLNLAIAFIIPTLVALATKRLASGGVKFIVLAVLSAVLAVFSETVDKGAFVWSSAALLFLTNIVVAVASHFGVTSQIGLSGKHSKAADVLFPNFGVGTPQSGAARRSVA